MSDYFNPAVLKLRTSTTLSFGSTLSQFKKYMSYQNMYFQGHDIFSVPCQSLFYTMHSLTTNIEFELILKSQNRMRIEKEEESGCSSLRVHLHFALNVTFISQKKQ